MNKILLLFVIFSWIMADQQIYAQPFSIDASIHYEGTAASGSYQIFRTSSINNITVENIRKPVIVVEGFDPNDDFDISNIYNIMDYNSPNSVADQLHNEGYDVVILNFDDGGDLIQRNAYLLVELINQINANKPHSEPLVVVGFSMGGLVARYALTYMEENGMNHETKLYVSFDSPHKGAHVPVGIQAFAKTFDSEVYESMFPGLGEALKLTNAPAAKQMLKYYIDDPAEYSGELAINPVYQTFFNDLKSQNNYDGFPRLCRKVGISLGSWNGIGQRSNLDLNSDGTNDLQHSGFPYLFINIPKGGGNTGPQTISQLNECETIATFSF
jgi:pimeloyl-ACP methyl ester carboxylesterase